MMSVSYFLCYPEQVCEDLSTYVKPIQELGGEIVYGPPQLTEAWQPCGAGHVIATLKMIARDKLKDYTDKVKYEGIMKNWQVWQSGKVTTSEKRILMTWVYGEAWADFCLPKYDYCRRMAFEKCGMHITKNGKNDDQVTAEGDQDPWQGTSGSMVYRVVGHMEGMCIYIYIHIHI
jgi:hypothetical protein